MNAAEGSVVVLNLHLTGRKLLCSTHMHSGSDPPEIVDADADDYFL